MGGAAAVKLSRGTLVVVGLDPTLGHEQRGMRPCVVVSDPGVNSDQRFPLVCVVPVTSTPGKGLLYPELTPARGGLAKRSFAMIDQLRSVDKRRIRSVHLEVAAEDVAAIDAGLREFLGLAERVEDDGAVQ